MTSIASSLNFQMVISNPPNGQKWGELKVWMVFVLSKWFIFIFFLAIFLVVLVDFPCWSSCATTHALCFQPRHYICWCLRNISVNICNIVVGSERFSISNCSVLFSVKVIIFVVVQNGSYDGLVGELEKEKTDIGWANLYLNVDRSCQGLVNRHWLG